MPRAEVLKALACCWKRASPAGKVITDGSEVSHFRALGTVVPYPRVTTSMDGGLLGAFDEVNPRVDDFDVYLLNPVGIAVPGHIDRSIAQCFQLSASASGQSDDDHSF